MEKLTEKKLIEIELSIADQFHGSRRIEHEAFIEYLQAALHIATALGYDVDSYLKEQQIESVLE
jgi:hypothetical protein